MRTSLSTKSNNTWPSIIALSRQGCPHLRNTYEEKNKSSLGAYEIKSSDGETQVNLIATGSEVSLAVEVYEELKSDGINSRVVSAPSFELFNKQDNDYIDQTLGQSGLRVGIEASTGLGWHNYLGDKGLFIGMNGFGASAPAEQLYKNFGIDKENIINS